MSIRRYIHQNARWMTPRIFQCRLGRPGFLREGTDVTIIATHTYVQKSLNVAEKLAAEGLSAEVIDPRTLVPMDWDAMAASVEKTGRAVVVHEAHRTGGAGAEIAAELSERTFRYLDSPDPAAGREVLPASI